METSKAYIVSLLLYSFIQLVLAGCDNCPNGVICVDGFDWNGNTCVYSGRKLGTTCTNGYYWKGNKCVSYRRGRGFPECDSGSIWNSGSVSCLKINNQEHSKQTIWGNCVEGYYWNGKSCLILNIINIGLLGNISPQECILGYSWNGYTCVFAGNTAGYTCLDGFYWNGITCTYSQNDIHDGRWGSTFGNSQNYIFGNNLFYPITPIQGSGGNYAQNYELVYSCIQGTVWNGQACVYSGSNINACANGYYWDGITCIYYGSLTTSTPTICQYGKLWNGYSCIDSNNNLYGLSTTYSICPPGYYSNGYYCLPASPTSCTNSQVWNGIGCSSCPCNYASSCQGFCQGGTIWSGSGCIGYQPYCPTGYVWNGVTCVIHANNVGIVNSNVQCISGYIWNGFGCVYLGAGASSTNVPGVQICSINYIWDGSKCLLSQSICATGYIWTGVNCVLTQSTQTFQTNPQYIQQSPQYLQTNYQTNYIQNSQVNFQQNTASPVSVSEICAPGYTYGNGVCTINTQQHSPLYQCISGHVWNGAACIASNPGIGTTGIPSCPNGFVWTGQTCMPYSGSNNINCAGGYVWSYPSGFCIPYTQYSHGYGTINCISGTYWNGAGCIQYPSIGNNIGGFGNSYGKHHQFGNQYNQNSVSSTIIVVINTSSNKYCLNDWVWNGYSCVNLGGSSCQAGQYWNGNVCQRSRIGKFCNQGQYWNGVQCILYNDTNYNTHCHDGYYWFHPGKTCALQQPINICSSCQ